MDTPQKVTPDALDHERPCRIRCRNRAEGSFPRLTAGEVDLARRLSTLLGAPTSRAGDPWPLVRTLVGLMSPDAIRDIHVDPEALTRDGEWALLTVAIRRCAAECELLVLVQCQIHAEDEGEDTQESTAAELVAYGHSVPLDAGVTLSPGELDYVEERIAAARAWLREEVRR